MRVLGALLAVACFYIAGLMIAAEEGKKLTAAESLYSLCVYMSRRISAQREPLRALFDNASDEYLENIGFLPLLRSRSDTPGALWKKGIALLSLTPAAAGELAAYGETLGEIPLAEQERSNADIIAYLREYRDALAGEIPAKKKCIRTVALICGLLAVIIML